MSQKFNPNHAILPCNVINPDNHHNKWSRICSTLSNPIEKIDDLFQVISKTLFNTEEDGPDYVENFNQFVQYWKSENEPQSNFGKNSIPYDLRGLKDIITYWKQNDTDQILQWRVEAIRIMQIEAQKVQSLFSQEGVPLLRELDMSESNEAHVKVDIQLSREKIASLIANAFFCTFPFRSSYEALNVFYMFPHFNFTSFYEKIDDIHIYSEKLNCIFAYFYRYAQSTQEFKNEIVSFIRQGTHFEITNPNGLISNVTIMDNVGMEDFHTENVSKVDFANKFIGGGTLRKGCVQEEILFLTHPECLVSLLIFEKMRPHEAIIITNARVFSKFTGYGKTFKWDPEDPHHSRNYDFIAIDAIPYKSINPTKQYMKKYTVAEIHKCHSGFYPHDGSSKPILTGNWGCGVFQGDPQYKFAIQLYSASNLGRDLIYLTYKDPRMKKASQVSALLKSSRLTIDQFGQLIFAFNNEKRFNSKLQFFDFLLKVLSSNEKL